MITAARRFEGSGPHAIQAAYARMAGSYDYLFGPLLAPARSAAIQTANLLPGRNVLEVGVGTGLALPKYNSDKKITGIDMSADMLAKAQARVLRLRIVNVHSLLEMDAQATSFADARFDVAVAMFVASVVPDPRALLAEMRRVVKPGGTLIFVNHFASSKAVPEWWRKGSGMVSAKLGWRADFWMQDIFTPADIRNATIKPLQPLGLFDLIELRN